MAEADYTIEMRQLDAQIDAMIPHEPRQCWCTGACRPDNAAYQGACVCVPRYHLCAEMERELERIALRKAAGG